MRWIKMLHRHWLSLLPGAMLAGLLFNCLCGPASPQDLISLSRYATRLTHENNQLQVENEQLSTEIGRLKTDDTYLQRLIRQRLGYARPDEFVYRFPHTPDR